MHKHFVKWDEYIRLLGIGVNVLQPLASTIDVVVGLTRGGLYPAVFFSHHLNTPMITFEPHLLHSNGVEREQIHLPISPPVVKKILIVDDISDTGKTFDKCEKFFRNRGFECITMSVFINRTRTNFVPNYPGVDSEGKWIVFPYEVD